jgi:hypothetical protein
MAIRQTFGRHITIRRCQIDKARNSVAICRRCQMCIFRPLSLYRFFHFSTPNAAYSKSMSLM